MRYQHAADIRTDLQRLRRDTDSGRSASGQLLDAIHRVTISGAEQVAREAAPVPQKKVWKIGVLVAALFVAALVGGGLYYRSQQAKRLTDKDSIVLADFANSTGDPVFDDALRQALTVALNQSPFLNVLGENKVATTLKLMARPANSPLTPEVARELCQRAGSKAYIAGSIASLGSEYVLGLKAVNCQSGDVLAQEQVTGSAKEKVLDALGRGAAKLRGELGESLASVQKFDVPLEDATTSSLEALKALSLGIKAEREKMVSEGLPYFQHAIQLDPNFAAGYYVVGDDYYSMGEVQRASEYYTKAFELREHASEPEKLRITARFYSDVTGELDKAVQALQEYRVSYPQHAATYNYLGAVYAVLAQYEKAIEAYRQSIRLDPDDYAPYENLANSLLAVQRFDEARQTIRQAQARKWDDYLLHGALYALAFLGSDSSATEEQQKWFADQPGFANIGLSLASDTEAYAGHLSKARELTKRSVESAIHAENKETGAVFRENAALREAAYGNATETKQAAADGLKLAPASQAVNVEAALAYAMAGDTARAESMAQDLNKRFPLDTQVQFLWLSAIHAQAALIRKNPTVALDSLQAAIPVELGQIKFVDNISCLYPTYIRGKAYLAAGQGQPAAAEFQKVIDHSGIVWNCWTGALAHLRVARANADATRTRAIAACKEFLAIWKDADPDIPIFPYRKPGMIWFGSTVVSG